MVYNKDYSLSLIHAHAHARTRFVLHQDCDNVPSCNFCSIVYSTKSSEVLYIPTYIRKHIYITYTHTEGQCVLMQALHARSYAKNLQQPADRP
jgi:hypothetical protein